MKKKFLAVLLIVMLTSVCYAQQQEKNPKWLSSKGYWMVESNVHTPKSSIIYFFNNDNVLVYKEKVEGMKVKINKTKVRMSLKNVLDESVLAWEQKHISRENDFLVAVALKK